MAIVINSSPSKNISYDHGSLIIKHWINENTGRTGIEIGQYAKLSKSQWPLNLNLLIWCATHLCLACTGALLFPPWCLITMGALSVPLSPSVSLVPVVREFFSWLNIDEFLGLLPFVVELVSLSRIKVFRLSMTESSLVFVKKSMFSLVGVMSSIMNVFLLSASRASRRLLSCVDWFTCNSILKLSVLSICLPLSKLCYTIPYS